MKGKNLDHARSLYVEGIDMGDGTHRYPTTHDVAEATGFSDNYVEKVCARDKWTEQRERFRARVETMTREKKARKLAEAKARLDEMFFETSQAFLTLTRHQCRELQRQVEKATRDNSAAPAQLKSISTAGLAMMRLQTVSSLAVGEASEIHRHEMPRGEFTVIGGFGNVNTGGKVAPAEVPSDADA